jgi:hypothetical protein
MPSASAPFRAKAPFHARVLGLNYKAFGLDYINSGIPSRFGCLSVSISVDFNASGHEGGPFTPESVTYTLVNVGGTAINWTVTLNQSWLQTSLSGGTLGSGETQFVTISLDADGLAADPTAYSGSITWTNTTNGCGNSINLVNLSVQEPLPPELPELRMDVRNVRDYLGNPNYYFIGVASTYETTRLNDAGTAWVGATAPPAATPTKWFYTNRVDDTAPTGNWFNYGSGSPRLAGNWLFSGSGNPPTPIESQFAPGVQWAEKLVHPLAEPKPPAEGEGPVVIIPSFIQHEVGFGQGDVQGNLPYRFTLRLTNTGLGPLIFGTPTLTLKSGEEAFGSWSLDTYSIPTIDPGDYFELNVTGTYLGTDFSDPYDNAVMLTLPNNLSGDSSPDIYLDFSIAIQPDE